MINRPDLTKHCKIVDIRAIDFFSTHPGPRPQHWTEEYEHFAQGARDLGVVRCLTAVEKDFFAAQLSSPQEFPLLAILLACLPEVEELTLRGIKKVASLWRCSILEGIHHGFKKLKTFRCTTRIRNWSVLELQKHASNRLGDYKMFHLAKLPSLRSLSCRGIRSIESSVPSPIPPRNNLTSIELVAVAIAPDRLIALVNSCTSLQRFQYAEA
jgi:hypothetical protein